jgi:DNA-binding HxlR family transcriptional regulator
MATRGPEVSVTDEEILNQLGSGDAPFDTASSLSDRVDLSRQRLSDRLQSLWSDGVIERAETSGIVLYWHQADYPATGEGPCDPSRSATKD